MTYPDPDDADHYQSYDERIWQERKDILLTTAFCGVLIAGVIALTRLFNWLLSLPR